MLIPILFWSLAALCCGYAIVHGGRDGRLAALLLIAAAIATIPATRLGQGWVGTEVAVFIVDGLLLAGCYALMVASRRFWPI